MAPVSDISCNAEGGLRCNLLHHSPGRNTFSCAPRSRRNPPTRSETVPGKQSQDYQDSATLVFRATTAVLGRGELSLCESLAEARPTRHNVSQRPCPGLYRGPLYTRQLVSATEPRLKRRAWLSRGERAVTCRLRSSRAACPAASMVPRVAGPRTVHVCVGVGVIMSVERAREGDRELVIVDPSRAVPKPLNSVANSRAGLARQQGYVGSAR